MGVVGVALAAVQLLPTYELSRFSVRAGGADFALAASGSLLPTGLVGFLFPHWRFLAGPGVETLAYVGLLPLMLALATLSRAAFHLTVVVYRLTVVVYRSRQFTRSSGQTTSERVCWPASTGRSLSAITFFWLLAGLATLLAFGRYTPLYGLLYHLPGFNLFRIPSRFIHLTVFSLALLSGVGLDSLLKAGLLPAGGQKLQRVVVRPLGGTFVSLSRTMALAMVGAVVGGNVMLRLGKEPLLAFAERYARTQVHGTAYHLQSWEYYQDKILRIYDTALSAVNPLAPRTFVPLLIIAVAFALFSLCDKHKVSSQVIGGAVALLTAADLLFRLGGLARPDDMGPVLTPPPAVAMVSGGGRIYKVLTEAELVSGEDLGGLPANYNMLFGVPNVGVYSALGMKRYYDLMSSLGSVSLAFGARPVSEKEVQDGLPLLSLLNVRYILSRQPISDPRLRLRVGAELGADWLPVRRPSEARLYVVEEPIRVYENLTALPRTFVVLGCTVASNQEQALAMVRSPQFDPRAMVVLEGVPTHRSEGFVSSEARIVHDEDQRVVIETEGGGWLLLADTYYPGWRVFVDSVEAKIYRADYVLRAVPLGPGQHRVEFVYDPPSFKTGQSISLATVLLVAAVVAIKVARPSRARLAEE